VFRMTRGENTNSKKELLQWFNAQMQIEKDVYSSHLHSQSEWNALNVEKINPIYADEPTIEDGRVIVRDNFDKIFEQNPNVLIFGEDSGNIGDVNQGLEGLQEKYGEAKVSDT